MLPDARYVSSCSRMVFLAVLNPVRIDNVLKGATFVPVVHYTDCIRVYKGLGPILREQIFGTCVPLVLCDHTVYRNVCIPLTRRDESITILNIFTFNSRKE